MAAKALNYSKAREWALPGADWHSAVDIHVAAATNAGVHR